MAYGKTASERRRSRVELWTKQTVLTHGFSNPQRVSFILYLCATTPAAANKWLGDGTLKGFVTSMRDHPALQSESILRELGDHPDDVGQWGRAAKLDLAGNRGREDSELRITEGLSLRLRIPFAQSTIQSIQKNGRRLEEASTDEGFRTWTARGYRFV